MEEIELIITARERDLGGFHVHRILPCATHPHGWPFHFFRPHRPSYFFN